MNGLPLRVQRKQTPRGKREASAVAVHEAGHVLVGLKTGRKLLQVWVRSAEGSVDFEPFRRFPGVARIRRRLAVDVAGHLAEDLAAGLDRERLSRRLAGCFPGPGPGPGRATAPRLPARTPATSVARARGGWPRSLLSGKKSAPALSLGAVAAGVRNGTQGGGSLPRAQTTPLLGRQVRQVCVRRFPHRRPPVPLVWGMGDARHVAAWRTHELGKNGQSWQRCQRTLG
jgi:hypothetical protein